jgi:hypothetical protein
LCLAVLGATGCFDPGPQPKAEAEKDEAKAAGVDTSASTAKQEDSAEKAEADSPEAKRDDAKKLAAVLNPEGCTKPAEGKPVAYRLTAFGANAAASLTLRLDLSTSVMTGDGFRIDDGGLVPEKVDHAIGADKLAPFTSKLDGLCLNFAELAPDFPPAASGYTRYGVEFEDGSVRWMSDTNPGLEAGEVFGKMDREKWLDLNKSWPKYQDAKPVTP